MDLKQGQIYEASNGFIYWISKINKDKVYLRFSEDDKGAFLVGTKEELLEEITKGRFKLIEKDGKRNKKS